MQHSRRRTMTIIRAAPARPIQTIRPTTRRKNNRLPMMAQIKLDKAWFLVTADGPATTGIDELNPALQKSFSRLQECFVMKGTFPWTSAMVQIRVGSSNDL